MKKFDKNRSFIYLYILISRPANDTSQRQTATSHHWDEEAQVEERVAVMPTEGCVIIWWQPMEQHLQAY